MTHAAVVPRSCRLNDVMSRDRNRHCRPCLNAGRTLRRASSFTVSGLKSRLAATSLLLSRLSSRSGMMSELRTAGLANTSFWYQASPDRSRMYCSPAPRDPDIRHLELQALPPVPETQAGGEHHVELVPGDDPPVAGPECNGRDRPAILA